MIIDGKVFAQQIESQVKAALAKITGRKPVLAFVRVGENPASITYIEMKKKKCREVGIESRDIELAEETTEQELLNAIDALNRDKEVDAILVQLPLPAHIETHRVFEAVDPLKDVDGFHPYNVGKLLSGDSSGFIPCTPQGIVILLEKVGVDPAGKHAVIVGRSNIVGKPLAALLIQKRKGANATVTVAHSQTENLSAITRSADILIAAMGHPDFIKAEMVKPGATIIDVGMNRKDGKLVGDVDFDRVEPIAAHITPVPGGVGPMTIAVLLSNTLLAHRRRR